MSKPFSILRQRRLRKNMTPTPKIVTETTATKAIALNAVIGTATAMDPEIVTETANVVTEVGSVARSEMETTT